MRDAEDMQHLQDAQADEQINQKYPKDVGKSQTEYSIPCFADAKQEDDADDQNGKRAGVD